MSDNVKRVPDIGVVIITKNESANIAACLESVLAHKGDRDVEIILVDSASTDTTVEVASHYPVTIVRLDPSPLLSPSVGRFVGTRNAAAPVIQFLDGDMILLPGWIESAFRALVEENIGGVAGLLHRSLPGDGERSMKMESSESVEVECFGGAAMYKRTALDRAGTFNPYMLGEEERELGYRIRREGFQLRKLPVDMAVHMEKVQDHGEVNEKSRYFRGVGQLIRAYPFTPIFWRIIALQRNEYLYQLMMWGLPLLAIVFAAVGLPMAALLTAGLLVLSLVALIGWKGPRKVVLFAKRRVLIPWNVAKGLFVGIGEAEKFPVTFRVETSEAYAKK